MFDQFNPKRGLNFFTFSGLLLVMLVLLVCSFPAALKAEENPAAAATTEAEAPTTSNAQAAPCQGLKPFNNLDELLYQFYINLESDCLFNMTPTELEKIWGIKILSSERAEGYEYADLKESAEFYDKPYRSAKDAFYVEAYQQDYNAKKPIRSFSINITKAYYKQTGRLFFSGKPPASLPSPFAVRDMMMGSSLTWFSADKTRQIYCNYAHPRGSADITSITIQNKMNPERFKEGAK